jgi:hypothetical protein
VISGTPKVCVRDSRVGLASLPCLLGFTVRRGREGSAIGQTRCAARRAGQAGLAPRRVPCPGPTGTRGQGSRRPSIRDRERPVGAGGAAPQPAPRTPGGDGDGAAVSVVDASRGGEGVSRKSRRLFRAGTPKILRGGRYCSPADRQETVAGNRGTPEPQAPGARRPRRVVRRRPGRHIDTAAPQRVLVMHPGRGQHDVVGCGEHARPLADLEPRGPAVRDPDHHDRKKATGKTSFTAREPRVWPSRVAACWATPGPTTSTSAPLSSSM